MKKGFCIYMLLAAAMVSASEYRTWTRAKSGKEIEAKMVDKLDDDSKAEVQMIGGKKYWLVASKLVDKDQKYIEDWTPNIEHLTVRVVGTKRGGKKKIRTVVKAGLEGLTIKIFRYPGDREPIVRKAKRRNEYDWKDWVRSNYIVKAFNKDGELVDKESWKSKTGL